MVAPIVSVLLPAYNAARYVRAAIQSVLRQSLSDFELIVLDDGSTDSTLTIVQSCAAADSRMRVISRPNAGLVPSLNEMLTVASAEFIARMDADDLCRHDRFALQVGFLKSHSECVALGSRALCIDPDGAPIHQLIQHFTHADIDRALCRPEIGILHPTVMMRRSAVEAVGGYRPDFPHVEDLDLFLRLGEIGQLANLHSVLLDYRLHLGSVSHMHTVAQQQSGRNAVAAAGQRRQSSKPPPLSSSDEAERAESRADLHRKWAWWALAASNLRTARKHAVRAVLADPSRSCNWRALACAVRGH